MTTSHLRHRRALLSMHRRSGSQLPPDVADGRCQRYRQDWREINCDEGGLFDTPRAIVTAGLLALGAWGVVGGFVLLAVTLLG